MFLSVIMFDLSKWRIFGFHYHLYWKLVVEKFFLCRAYHCWDNTLWLLMVCSLCGWQLLSVTVRWFYASCHNIHKSLKIYTVNCGESNSGVIREESLVLRSQEVGKIDAPSMREVEHPQASGDVVILIIVWGKCRRSVLLWRQCGIC